MSRPDGLGRFMGWLKDLLQPGVDSGLVSDAGP